MWYEEIIPYLTEKKAKFDIIDGGEGEKMILVTKFDREEIIKELNLTEEGNDLYENEEYDSFIFNYLGDKEEYKGKGYLLIHQWLG